MNVRSLSVRLLFFVCLLGLLPALSVPSAQAALPPAPSIAWRACHQETGFPFECATVQVPLDHNKPRGEMIELALVRLPASAPKRRIGSLFLNPGGPGGSGVDFVLGAGPILYSEEVRARFDMVGFDPRGIGRSTPLRCFNTKEEALASRAPFPFPITPQEQAAWRLADQKLAGACRQHAGAIINHMTTADVARDLDLLRQAVGDTQLTFAGYSYGSYLGVTYANLFPQRVRALVVDGVLDPIAWATGSRDESRRVPFSTRLRGDAGAQATLGEFFRLCDAEGSTCAFAGDAEARFASLVSRLRKSPVDIQLPDGITYHMTEAMLIEITLSVLYDSSIWPLYAEVLLQLEQLASPERLGAQIQRVWERLGLAKEPTYNNSVERFPGVACSDTLSPRHYGAWPIAAAQSERQYGYFSGPWTWISSICAIWPGRGEHRYLGPFTATTANPVLVMSTTYDPATRYEGALKVRQLLPNSALVTVKGWGHGALFLSQCADRILNRYLLDGSVPAQDAVCEQDVVPFAPASALQARGQETARAQVVRALVPEALRHGRGSPAR